MGRAKNTLNAADVSSTPIKVRFAASYASSSFGDYGITVSSGSNVPYSVNMTSAQMELMNNYRLVKQLYYQVYLTGSLAGSASFYDPVWQSTAASGSGDDTVYKFPTGSSDSILIYCVPSNQFGEQIGKTTFTISASDASYMIVDDGNGNLIDTLAANDHVGNIFYAQGIAVVTNQDYVTSYTYLAAENDDIYETENNIEIIIE